LVFFDISFKREFTYRKYGIIFPENYFMKKFLVLLLPVLFIACQKETVVKPAPVPHPAMHYTDLGNVSIKFGQQKAVNIDGDGVNDLLFSTMLVGDPILRRDRRQYYVNAAFHVFLLTNVQEQAPVLNNGDAITISNPSGYNWFNSSSVVLAEKIIEETGPEDWEGSWKDVDHKYLPVQIRKNDLRYNGWVEISFKTNTEEMILHRSAIATEAGKTVMAGH
jgi:hypothetical protein